MSLDSLRFSGGRRRGSHPKNLDGKTVFSGTVVVHLFGDIPYKAARSYRHGLFRVEFAPRSYQHRSFHNADEPVIVMEVRMAPVIRRPFEQLNIRARFRRITEQDCRLRASRGWF